ncbi:MAG: carbohydrate kinase [Nitrospinota bacterium]|nr:carbohydrate kinase [Nitrospinota bacterium]
MSEKNRGKPVIFGEILFDVFPDGEEALGGAPFNVAWSLKGFGYDPLIISRIGEDALGKKILTAMTQWGLDPSGVQIDPAHPTGQVRVSIHNGEPSFDITPNVAYDFIDNETAINLVGSVPPLIYHGALAARGGVSRKALLGLKSEYDSPVFVDVNLRPPWTPLPLLGSLVSGARYVKVNRDELMEITGASIPEGEDLTKLALGLRRDWKLDALVVTNGDKGAMMVEESGAVEGAPWRVEQVVDTVGAGDAFCAVVIMGLMSGWEKAKILDRALEFAASVCRLKGAVTRNAKHYSGIVERWRGEDEERG